MLILGDEVEIPGLVADVPHGFARPGNRKNLYSRFTAVQQVIWLPHNFLIAKMFLCKDCLWRDLFDAIDESVRMGTFSSDLSIREYCEKIWRVQPVAANRL
jgi:hypothetical protein